MHKKTIIRLFLSKSAQYNLERSRINYEVAKSIEEEKMDKIIEFAVQKVVKKLNMKLIILMKKILLMEKEL
ncbi:MAG: hypothetical protein GX247_01295 [Mollicutes bacterium]|nr:hypothetical protein [Mollicutes bacterium]